MPKVTQQRWQSRGWPGPGLLLTPLPPKVATHLPFLTLTGTRTFAPPGNRGNLGGWGGLALLGFSLLLPHLLSEPSPVPPGLQGGRRPPRPGRRGDLTLRDLSHFTVGKIEALGREFTQPWYGGRIGTGFYHLASGTPPHPAKSLSHPTLPLPSQPLPLLQTPTVGLKRGPSPCPVRMKVPLSPGDRWNGGQ